MILTLAIRFTRNLLMKRTQLLKKQQSLLKEQIVENLDLLVGSVGRPPSMMNYILTTKIGGKTVTRYVRKNLVIKVQKMTVRNKKVRELILKLSKINWELLKLESK